MQQSVAHDRGSSTDQQRGRFVENVGAVFILVTASLLLVTGVVTTASRSAGAATANTWIGPNQVPNMPGGSGSFADVSCIDATDCTGVGEDGNQQPFYVSETNGVWGTPTELAFPGGFASFSGVSCTDATDCTAVGEDAGHGFNWPIDASETAGVWSTPTEIPGRPAGDGFSDRFLGVSCPGAGQCTAVGQSSAAASNDPIYATETNGVWGALAVIPGNDSSGSLAGVTCYSIVDCTAVGSIGFGMTEPGWTTETNGVWSIPISIAGTPGGRGAFSGVSCDNPTDCTAVGMDGNDQPIVATETGSTWGTATEIPGSGGGSGSFSSVSCINAADCTAVGSDVDKAPMHATEVSSSWGTVTEIPGSPGGSGSFSGISCSDATDCTAVGSDGDNQPLYASSQTVPTVSEVSPRTGPSPGGTAVTISGTGFRVGATVEIGQGFGPGATAIPAIDVKVISSTEITAVTGSGAKPGTWSLYVSTTAGSSAPNLGDDYFNNGVPTVSGISPSVGPVSGGTPITITGTGFLSGATVEIGQGSGPAPSAIPATDVNVISSTEITAVTGGGAQPGTWSVYVISFGGTTPAVAADDFTYG